MASNMYAIPNGTDMPSTDPPKISSMQSDAKSTTTTTTTAATPNGESMKAHNAWMQPGPAAFDFRSDVMTTPTAAMLEGISRTTLLDDVFLEDPTTTSLERFIADLTSHQAGLLVMSGTMGNQVALRTHLSAPPHSVLCDHRCHVIKYEAGGLASLSGAMVQPVVPRNGHHLTLADVQAHAILGDEVHSCPTRVVSLENTLNGTILPLEDFREIARWCHANGIKVHVDGARLWEAVTAGAGSLQEYCKEVDSLSLCFSKGLGAPIGSVIVGSEEFIKRARWVRKSIGGGTRQAGVIAAAARVAVEETYLGGKLAQSHENARRVCKAWEALGGKLDFPSETNMVWLDLGHHGIKQEVFAEVAKKHGLKIMGGRMVVHYQICEEALVALEETMKEVLQEKGAATNGKG